MSNSEEDEMQRLVYKKHHANVNLRLRCPFTPVRLPNF